MVFNDSLSLALNSLPKASQSSPHKNTSCLGNLLLSLLFKLSLWLEHCWGIFAIVNQALIYLSIEDNHGYFYPPEDPNDHRFDVGNKHKLVEDVADPQLLIKLVKFLKRGKAPGPDTIHNEVLRLGTTTSLFHHLARLFTSSIQPGYIPTAWKIATLHMLLKPGKLPTLTASYRSISLISSIMKLFERVIEQRLRSHLEQIGFINKRQSGFRRAKSTEDHLVRLSQYIMESFNRGEHVVTTFLDVE